MKLSNRSVSFHNCEKCPSGRDTNDETGQITCSTCPTGWAVALMETGLTTCTNAQISPLPNDVVNDVCTTVAGKSTYGCTGCTAGQFTDVEDFQKGMSIEFIAETNYLDLYGCKDCSVGRSSEARAQKCLDCVAGMFNKVAGSACIHCPFGFVQPATGQKNCRKCKLGQLFTSASQACGECDVGKFGAKSGICSDCPVNSFQDAKGRTECTPCEFGQLYTSAAQACGECEAGRFGDKMAGACSACPNGQFQENKATTECKTCKLGESFVSSSQPCVDCDMGRFGSKEGECTICPVGKFQDVKKGKEKCQDCPINTYSNEEGKSSSADCSACPEKTTTGDSTGNSNQSACVCEEGYYKVEDFSDSNDNTDSTLFCVVCPKYKTNCSGIDVTLVTLPASRGYYRESNDSAVFHRCDKKTDCTGGLVAEQCREGHHGILCTVCFDGYVRKSGLCEKCPPEIVPDGGRALAMMATIPPLLLFLSLFYYFVKAKKEDEDEEEEEEVEVEEESNKGNGGGNKSKKKQTTLQTSSMTKITPKESTIKTTTPEVQPTMALPSSSIPTTELSIDGKISQTESDDNGVAMPMYETEEERQAALLMWQRKHGALGIQTFWIRRKLRRFHAAESAGGVTVAEDDTANTTTVTFSADSEAENDPKRLARLKVRRIEATLHLANCAFLAVPAKIRRDSVLDNVDDLVHNSEIMDFIQEEGQEEMEGVAESAGGAGEDEIEVEYDGVTDKLHNLADKIHVKDFAKFMLKTGKSLGHKLRILIGWLQITCSLVTSFDVPWPPVALDLFKGLTFINFNFMDFFEPLDACSLHTPFLKQAAFHMAILPLCLLVITGAAVLAMMFNKAQIVIERAGSVLVTLVFLLYPGIVTRVFMTLKCRQIGDKQYLVADSSVICWEGQHAQYYTTMVFFVFIYVIGIPAGSTFLLYMNRHILNVDVEEEDPELASRAESFQNVFGQLYDAYSEKYWYFESIIMIQKALLTGGLVLVSPGSSAQILVGLVIALTFYTLVLKLKPYDGEDEEMLQSVATASTVGTLLIGFALKATELENGANSSNQKRDFDVVAMDAILILMFFGVAFSGGYIVMKSLPCFKKGEEEEKDEQEQNGATVSVEADGDVTIDMQSNTKDNNPIAIDVQATTLPSDNSSSIDHLKQARRSLLNKIGDKTVHRDDALSIAHTRLYGPTVEELRYHAVEAMFHRLDLDHNGSLDKSELMTATANDEELSSYVSPSRALTLRKKIFEPMDLEAFQNFCSPSGERETEWTKHQSVGAAPSGGSPRGPTRGPGGSGNGRGGTMMPLAMPPGGVPPGNMPRGVPPIMPGSVAPRALPRGARVPRPRGGPRGARPRGAPRGAPRGGAGT